MAYVRIFELDRIPPSLNNCYFHRVLGKGAKKWVQKGYTKEAKAFFKYLETETAGKTCPEGRLALNIKIRFKDRRKRDIDNYLKVCGDALQCLVGDDSRFDKVCIERLEPGEEYMRIEISNQW